MKKLLLALLVILIAFSVSGCSGQENALIIEEEVLLVEDGVEEVNVAPVRRERGHIVGDVFYEDTPISRLFEEPFLDVLGEALDQDGALFFYEGLEIMGDRGDLIGKDMMAIYLSAFSRDLGLFTLDGLSLDMTRVELVAAFGAPLADAGRSYFHRYYVVSPAMVYELRFEFADLDGATRASSITIFPVVPAAEWNAEFRIISGTTPEQFVGTWANSMGESYVILGEIPQGEYWTIIQLPNGSYMIIVDNGSGAHYEKWFFPIGVEMVRYGTNWSLVPSDTSRERLFVGTFAIMACCPDEEIDRELFYRID